MGVSGMQLPSRHECSIEGARTYYTYSARFHSCQNFLEKFHIVLSFDHRSFTKMFPSLEPLLLL